MSIQIFLHWLACLLLLWSPGHLLGEWLALPKRPDRLVRVATQLCIGLAFWPVLFLWSTTLGWQWTSPSASLVSWMVVTSAIVTAGYSSWRRSRSFRLPIWRLPSKRIFYAAMTLLFALSAFVRIYQIRNLVLPAWVDSVHHTAITRLLVEQGRLPATYAPYAPDAQFLFHWGFHALIAWNAWLLGQTEPLQLAQLVLHLGQLFNLLTVLMIYASTRFLFHSRRAGLFAALFVGVVSWFPIYYVAWGRYTELTGLLLAPIFLAQVWRLRRRATSRTTVLVALLGAGLVLIHMRVTVFALVFCLLLAVWRLLQRDWQTLRSWLLAGGLAALLVAPWLYHLLLAHELQQRIGFVRQSADSFLSSYNQVSWYYLLVPNNRELMAVASAGLSALFTWRRTLLWGRLLAALSFLLTAYACYRQPRSALRLLPIYALFFCYLLALALTLNLNWIGLPVLGFVTNDSAVIAAFVPLTILAGGLCGWVLGAIVSARMLWPTVLLCTLVIGPWGAWQLRSPVTARTVLATAADLQAFTWIERNLPEDAKFAVTVQPWLGNAYMGADGGYWLPLLTNRRSILPIALYTASGSSASIARINRLLDAWTGRDTVDDQILNVLLAEGVTHLYIGARHGRLQAEKLTSQPRLRQLYANGGVYIFALMQGDGDVHNQ